jgi:hypothetical protein
MDCQGHPDDILGDGSVMKSIIEEGEEPAVYPIFGDECITHFVGSLPDGSVFNDTMKRDQPFKCFGGTFCLSQTARLLQFMAIENS